MKKLLTFVLSLLLVGALLACAACTKSPDATGAAATSLSDSGQLSDRSTAAVSADIQATDDTAASISTTSSSADSTDGASEDPLTSAVSTARTSSTQAPATTAAATASTTTTTAIPHATTTTVTTTSTTAKPTTTTTTTPPDTGAYAAEVVQLVNLERANAGLPALTTLLALTAAANVRAQEIKQVFSHTRPDGTNCFTVLSGIPHGTAGENIAAGQPMPAAVMQTWMNSDGHRANILDSHYTTIGVGVYISGGMVYWVQEFIG